jgi:hypothetical protein
MNIVKLYQEVILKLLAGDKVDTKKAKECYYRLSVDLDKAVVDNLPSQQIALDREAVMWIIERF